MSSFPSSQQCSSLLIAAITLACASGGASTGASQAEPRQHGSIVTSEDAGRTPDEPIEKQLASRVPGIIVDRTSDGGIAIRLRGATTILGSNAPLYIVDGIPIEAGPNGSLTGINPMDIASIEVLKDATATSMYGVRGANGVIIIKTKITNH
ncbi:MAG TPA: TonB-dependent receptor plug domain-containing protein [Gemmatimonadaceae bacterium]|nr:TonB-dependent receptor plug domain-containing protein [Gemmatimonadaceae bacterium]